MWMIQLGQSLRLVGRAENSLDGNPAIQLFLGCLQHQPVPTRAQFGAQDDLRSPRFYRSWYRRPEPPAALL
ncbi:hypothetical protein ACG83_04525 [Frankia sp. R43]|nr:hypothetical protein ACG83_04525 [Frankia sp. R43]